jgi:hypothetical protein
MRFRTSAGVLVFVLSGIVVTSAGPAAASSARPAGQHAGLAATAGTWQRAGFRGVTLRVPAGWPVIRLARHPEACPRLNVHAVYLGAAGPHPACPPGLHGRTEAVQIQPARPGNPDVREARVATSAGGRPALTNADAAVTHTITEVIPSAAAQVSVTWGTDRPLAAAIAASIRVSGRAAARPAVAAALAARPAAIRATAPQGVFRGAGFDTCAAPSAATLSRWLASPYRAVGIYIGGINRACAQSSLTAAWIAAIRAKGWHYFPFYPGLQASCVLASGDALINRAKAAREGTAAAADAVTQARNLAIPAGTPIIYDMEAYAGCGKEVTTFLSAWDAGVRARGYTAGVYESFSNIGDLIAAAGTMTEPGVIAYADWDGKATTTSSYMPATMWTGSTRIHQYAGGHHERWGGISLDIDNDQLNVNLAGGRAGPPPAAGHAGFRLSVHVNPGGSAEWFARSAAGRLLHSWQHPGTGGWSAVQPAGRSPTGLAGNPAVTADADGRLTVFARTSAGRLRHAWQQPGAPDGWKWGGPLRPASSPAAMTGDPAAVRLPGGAAAVFVAAGSGAVYTIAQARPDADARWTRWHSLGGRCHSSPTAFVTRRRAVEVFCVTTGHRLAVDSGAAAGGGVTWSGWAQAGAGPGRLSGVPSVAADGRGQTEVLVNAAGRIRRAWQAAAGGPWIWAPALGPAGAGGRIRNSPSAAGWPGGRVAVVARLADGQAGLAVQQGAAAGGRWTSLTSIGGTVAGSPAGWLNPRGGAGVAALNAARQVAAASYSGRGWSNWAELGGGF